MRAKQLSHIQVLVAGPAPPAYIGQHLPNLDAEFSVSEETNPANAAKDQAYGATDVAEEKQTDIIDLDDEAKQS